MDRVTSIILGRPSAIRDEDVDHACPQEDLSLSTAYQSVTGHQLAFVFPHIVAYRLLYGEIAAKLHRKRPVGMDGRAALDLRTSLKDRLDAWYSSTVMSIRVEAQRAAKQSVHAIFAAAKSAIHLYTGLHKAGHINHTSITLQAVFMAGLSYIYAVSRQFRQRMPNDTAELTDSMLGAQVPAIGEVISTTRACSNVLVAISERWNMTRHCCDVFDRLADAVLADAIKLQTTRYGAQPNTTQQRSRIEDTNASMTMWDPTENPGPPALNTAGQQVLAVDNEFIESYGDIQNLFDFQQFDDPIADLSEDWMGWIGLGAQENTLWNPTRA
ncbi:hypothetical protein KVT40_001884 [Elsinoe batatas]|uniref:Uncharacterized protein n=1 Tax=Elsinoe batatas TaxID=2601811 RepID=A0A8K0LA14_9PEZI|nr:hypothetical protein KVT40_001884 [Elsinoe batatas]